MEELNESPVAAQTANKRTRAWLKSEAAVRAADLLAGVIAIALIFWWLKMPSPILWGVFTFVLEFIPYLGAALMILMISLVAFATFIVEAMSVESSPCGDGKRVNLF